MRASRPQPTWRIALKAIAVFVLVILAFFGFLVFVSAAGSFRPLLLVVSVALVLGLLWAGVVRLFTRGRPGRPLWGLWLAASAVWTLLLLALLAVPLFYATTINTTRALAMPRITLSDGEKEVVFQGMIHIGSGSFYEAVVFDMARAADEEYVLLFEGVRRGTAANTERMNAILGTQGLNLNQIYDAFAQTCGLTFQNEYFIIYADDMAENPDQFVNADVSVDDMMAEWDRLLAKNPEFAVQVAAAQPEDEIDNRLDTTLSFIAGLTPGQRRLLELGCQTYLNRQFGQLGGAKDPFKDQVVLAYRNRHLADAILAQTADRVYVTYGYDHFRGVFKLLQEANPAWEIVDVRWRQAIDSETEIEREVLLEE